MSADDDLPPLPADIPLGLYRHYKGLDYWASGVVRHSETLEPLVLYVPLYGDEATRWTPWVRPLAMFNETVTIDGVTRRRFAPLAEGGPGLAQAAGAAAQAALAAAGPSDASAATPALPPGAAAVTGQPVYRLFGTRGSGSAAVEMALRAAGLAYAVVHASSWEPESAQAALRAANPLMQIPTLLLPDGSVLTESVAILLHLALTHPQAPLLPADAALRAQAIRGLVHIAAHCYSAVSVGDFPARWTTATDEAAHQAVRAAARAQLHRAWEVFADTLADPLLLWTGPQGLPGALAFLAVVVSQWSGTRAHLQQHRPAFYAQLLQLEAHPLIAPVLRAHRATEATPMTPPPLSPAILAPVFVLAGWTLTMLLMVAIRRVWAARGGTVPVSAYALGESAQVPQAVSLFNRNYMNLLELPLLFYVGVLIAWAGQLSSPALLALAWAYVGLRVLHSLVHVTYNQVLHRFAVFAASNGVLLAFWVLLARALWPA